MVHKRNLSYLLLIFKIYMKAYLKQEPKQVIAEICHMDQKQERPSKMLQLQRCPPKKRKVKIITAWKRRPRVLNKHFTVQTYLLLKTFSRNSFYFAKYCSIVSLPLASLELSWKPVGGTRGLVTRELVFWNRISPLVKHVSCCMTSDWPTEPSLLSKGPANTWTGFRGTKLCGTMQSKKHRTRWTTSGWSLSSVFVYFFNASTLTA